MTETRDDAYHIQSLKCAFLREQLGGVKADDSGMAQKAYAALIARGYDPMQIVGMYAEAAGVSSKTDTSGASNG